MLGAGWARRGAVPVRGCCRRRCAGSTMAAQTGGGEGLGPAPERIVGGDGHAVVSSRSVEDLEQQLGRRAVSYSIQDLSMHKR